MGLSLWIVPNGEIASKLESVMDTRPENRTEETPLTQKSYPKFHPHITLASLPLSIEADLDAIAQCIPTPKAPLKCEFAAVETGTHYYRSVYIRIALSAELAALHKHVHEELGVEPRTPSFPHLSLCYIDDADAANGERDRFYAAVAHAGRIRRSGESEGVSVRGGDGEEEAWLDHFVACEIWVVRCEGPVESWVVLRKVAI